MASGRCVARRKRPGSGPDNPKALNKKRPASIDASLFQNNNQSTPHKVNSEVIPYLGREHIGIKSGLADVVIIQTHRHSAQLVISPHARFVTVAYRTAPYVTNGVLPSRKVDVLLAWSAAKS